MVRILGAERLRRTISRRDISRLLVALAILAVVFYLAWILRESPVKFLQFTFNGIIIGAIYAMVAMGFSLVYGTVWFFDLSYAVMTMVGGYTVFYFTGKQVQTVGRGDLNNTYLNIFMGVLIAGVVAWILYTWLYPELRRRYNRYVLLAVGGLVALAVGSYTGLVMANPGDLNVYLSPVIGVLVAAAAGLVLYHRIYVSLSSHKALARLGFVVPLVLGAYCGWLVASLCISPARSRTGTRQLRTRRPSAEHPPA